MNKQINGFEKLFLMNYPNDNYNEIKSFFERVDVIEKFKNLLGQSTNAFITNLLQVIHEDIVLMRCDVLSIYNASVMAATLDLPIAKGLGFAFILPNGNMKAQFQIGYKGYIQLAQKSGLFKSINSTPIYQGQLVEYNPLDGHIFDMKAKVSNNVIGYAAKFTLLNGFEAINYMSVEELKKHGNKYSDSYRAGAGLWHDNFDAMATKTVLKLLLSKQAPLSTDMAKAIVVDQSVIEDVDSMNVIYADNQRSRKVFSPPTPPNKEEERLLLMIQDCKTKEQLAKLKKHIKNKEILESAYYTKITEIKKDDIDTRKKSRTNNQ